jgi:methionine-gamma-lyase
MKEVKKKGLNTRTVHSGEKTDPSTNALKIPISTSNTFAYENMQEFLGAAANAYSYDLEDFSYFYTRTANPTTNALEQKLTSVIGCEAVITTGSGMAAIAMTLLANCQKNSRILVSDSMYRSTNHLATEIMPKFGIEYECVDFRDLELLEKLLKTNNYSLVYFESPANPTMRCYDIKEISSLVHEFNIETNVLFDNTFATPVCQQPLDLGVDFEIHSISKYINGHGDALGGAICSNDKEKMSDIRQEYGETFGRVPSPFNSYLIMRGIKTLGLRVAKQSENALNIAKFLSQHKKVKNVYYPGLDNHPQALIAKKQMNPFGGMLAFELESIDAVSAFLDSKLKLIKLAMDLGDIQSLIEFPYIMTHYDLDDDLKIQTGITDTLIRLSVGIEQLSDIVDDLNQSLAEI